MSYSILEARGEELSDISEAIKKDDEQTLFLKAQYAKDQGDDEYAEMLRKLAMIAQRNNWAYDEARDNQLQDDLN